MRGANNVSLLDFSCCTQFLRSDSVIPVRHPSPLLHKCKYETTDMPLTKASRHNDRQSTTICKRARQHREQDSFQLPNSVRTNELSQKLLSPTVCNDKENPVWLSGKCMTVSQVAGPAQGCIAQRWVSGGACRVTPGSDSSGYVGQQSDTNYHESAI
jgi:hypothetical protein